MARKPAGTARKGRPPGPAKANGTAATAAAANGPPDALILKHLRLCTDAKTTLDEANGVYRAALKAAKTDGVQQNVLIATMVARKKEAELVGLDLASRVRYFTLAGIPVGTQLGLFKPPVLSADDAGEQAEWDADSAGYQSGRTGGELGSNPANAGSAEHAAWVRGWKRGQASIAKQLGQNAKVASTRRKRGAEVQEQPALVQ